MGSVAAKQRRAEIEREAMRRLEHLLVAQPRNAILEDLEVIVMLGCRAQPRQVAHVAQHGIREPRFHEAAREASRVRLVAKREDAATGISGWETAAIRRDVHYD